MRIYNNCSSGPYQQAKLSGQISRWILLFLELDNEVVYKLGKIHVIPDALSHFNLEESTTDISMWLPNEGKYETNEADVTFGLPLA